MPTNPFVPPGGFAGFAQQTPAVQAMLAKTPRKKTKKKAKKKPAATRARSATKKKAGARKNSGRLVKGSAEAKRRMAEIRKKRKK